MVPVQDVGIHVGTVWPNNRPELVVNAHLTKDLRLLAQWFEDGAPQLVLEVDLAHDAVVEGKFQYETVERLDGADARDGRSRGHGNGQGYPGAYESDAGLLLAR